MTRTTLFQIISAKKRAARPVSVLLLFFCLFFVIRLCAPRPDIHRDIIMEHTPLETSFTVIDSGKPGAVILVVGGIHGDEVSGRKAAERLTRFRGLKRGTLIILSPANAPGSRLAERCTETHRDLNRSFPGDRNRDLTDQLAASVFSQIEDYSPSLVIDLHEACREESGRDFLGNSFILTEMDPVGDLVYRLVCESQDGSLPTSAPFTWFNGTPKGSLNRTVTELLQIPVITVEVSQEEAEATRISNHLSVIYRILAEYGLSVS